MCCGCDTFYIVSVHLQCQASIYLHLCWSRAFMAGAASQAGDADSSRAPGLTSGLQGSVHVKSGALLLVPQWQCISSFVFSIRHSVLLEDIFHRTEIISVWPEKIEEFSIRVFQHYFFFSLTRYNLFFRTEIPSLFAFLSANVDANFLLFGGFTRDCFLYIFLLR